MYTCQTNTMYEQKWKETLVEKEILVEHTPLAQSYN